VAVEGSNEAKSHSALAQEAPGRAMTSTQSVEKKARMGYTTPFFVFVGSKKFSVWHWQLACPCSQRTLMGRPAAHATPT